MPLLVLFVLINIIGAIFWLGAAISLSLLVIALLLFSPIFRALFLATLGIAIIVLIYSNLNLF